MISNKINLFSIWLISLILCVIAIILIGGYTRISDSGLSITEWKPITGVLFPLSQSAWEIEFDKYKLIDEFKLVNSLMTLEEFKFIYFWEWFHRFFARFIGLVFVIPLIYLVYKKLVIKSDLLYIILLVYLV
jgi:cytochrome c oxidase assembly protein subunit 15